MALIYLLWLDRVVDHSLPMAQGSFEPELRSVALKLTF